MHKDTLHSAMAVVSRLCSKMEPQDPSLPSCVESLSTLLRHEDSHVSFRIICYLVDKYWLTRIHSTNNFILFLWL